MKYRQVEAIQGAAFIVDTQGRRRALRPGDWVGDDDRLELPANARVSWAEVGQDAPQPEALASAWTNANAASASLLPKRSKRNAPAVFRDARPDSVPQGAEEEGSGHVSRVARELETAPGTAMSGPDATRLPASPPSGDVSLSPPAREDKKIVIRRVEISEHEYFKRGRLPVVDPDRDGAENGLKKDFKILSADADDYVKLEFNADNQVIGVRLNKDSPQLHALTPGERKTLVFEFETRDESTVVQLQLDIKGLNDVAEFKGPMEATLYEHAPGLKVTGQLQVLDLDRGESVIERLIPVNERGEATPEAAKSMAEQVDLQLGADGNSWVAIAKDTPRWHASVEGEKTPLYFVAEAKDGTRSAPVKLIKYGQNDDPTIGDWEDIPDDPDVKPDIGPEGSAHDELQRHLVPADLSA